MHHTLIKSNMYRTIYEWFQEALRRYLCPWQDQSSQNHAGQPFISTLEPRKDRIADIMARYGVSNSSCKCSWCSLDTNYSNNNIIDQYACIRRACWRVSAADYVYIISGCLWWEKRGCWRTYKSKSVGVENQTQLLIRFQSFSENEGNYISSTEKKFQNKFA
jgi:hypothetical protein